MLAQPPRASLAASLLVAALLAPACSTTSAPPVGDPGGSGPMTDAPTGDPPREDAPPAAGATSSSSGGPAVLPSGWGAAECAAPTSAVGFDVGDTIGDLGVKDCETGAPVSIDELCGASATWIFAAHTHCPTCQATAGFTDEVAAAVASKNVAIAHLVYDDNGTSCAKWRDAYKLAGFSNVRVYDDPGGAAWAKLKLENYTAPSAFLDAKRVVTFKKHSLAKAAVLTQIDAALAR